MRLCVLLLLLPLALSGSSSRSYCDESSYCDNTETCCPSQSNWMCCPFGAATCCGNGVNCCPADHPVCDTVGKQCKTGGLLQLVFQNERTVEFPSSPAAVADSFDARTQWPSCVETPAALSPCEEYLFSPLSSAYDRLCIAGVQSGGYVAGLNAVAEELPSNTECNSSLYDYAVLFLTTYGVPTHQGRVARTVTGVSLERETMIKREVMANGPVSVKCSSGVVGKLIGWTTDQWLLLDPKTGDEISLPLETNGLASVFSARE